MVPCEFCGVKTRAEGGVCILCSRDAIKTFKTVFVRSADGEIERRNLEIRRVKDSVNCVCTDIATRIRMKKLLAKTPEQGVPGDVRFNKSQFVRHEYRLGYIDNSPHKTKKWSINRHRST